MDFTVGALDNMGRCIYGMMLCTLHVMGWTVKCTADVMIYTIEFLACAIRCESGIGVCKISVMEYTGQFTGSGADCVVRVL